jgi:hypothetical protein
MVWVKSEWAKLFCKGVLMNEFGMLSEVGWAVIYMAVLTIVGTSDSSLSMCSTPAEITE